MSAVQGGTSRIPRVLAGAGLVESRVCRAYSGRICVLYLDAHFFGGLGFDQFRPVEERLAVPVLLAVIIHVGIGAPLLAEGGSTCSVQISHDKECVYVLRRPTSMCSGDLCHPANISIQL